LRTAEKQKRKARTANRWFIWNRYFSIASWNFNLACRWITHFLLKEVWRQATRRFYVIIWETVKVYVKC